MAVKRRTLMDIGLEVMTANAEAQSGAPDDVAPRVSAEPRSFVGRMLEERNSGLEAEAAEAAVLRGKVAALEGKIRGGELVVQVDPSRVRPSRFADRHERAFRDAEFDVLCEEIREAGRNTEAAVLRPVRDDPAFDYEIASGHRRHAACLRVGFPLHAIIREMSNLELLRQMQHENSARVGLSAFERGRQYAMLLHSGEYSSGRDLAAKMSVPQPTVVRLLKYADLPDNLISAFVDPREIRINWIEPMVSALAEEPARVQGVLEELAHHPEPKAGDVFRRITRSTPKTRVISDGEQVLGRIRTINGCPAVVLFKQAPNELMEEISAVVKRWAAEHGGDA
ncbi:ParB/RepB/Spo0J family partition protein [Rhodanobacter sp. FW106-PBR-R2A-1-13]|uniref:ParB/RepB/Spo0J family partition protein n=1 Tax=Rhodanobacter sp. FW106-PBR-R2A-1-13 TaxID=3454845 RepID=UPI0034E3FD1F